MIEVAAKSMPVTERQTSAGTQTWWIIDEPELHLGEDIVVPDLAGWRRERMPEYPETAYITHRRDVALLEQESTKVVFPPTSTLERRGARAC